MVTTVTSEGFLQASGKNASLLANLPMPLDGFSPAFAVSWRRLFSDYTGPIADILRSSDGNYLSLYPLEKLDGIGNLWANQSSLLSFVGNSSGHVSRWYDQARGNHPQMATQLLQPRCVTGGVQNLSANKLTTNYSEVGSTLATPSRVLSNSAGLTCFAVSAMAGRKLVYSLNGEDQSKRLTLICNGSSTSVALDFDYLNGAGSYNRVSGSRASTSVSLTTVSTVGTATLRVNGNLVKTDTVAFAGNPLNSGVIHIGSSMYGGTLITLGGISEMVVFDSPLTPTQIIQIERNIGAAYGIAIP